MTTLYELLSKLAVSRLAFGVPPVTHGDVIRPERLKDRVYAGIDGATPVRIDEAAERFFVEESREGWAYTRDFGDVTPPFGLFFLEGGRPSRVVSETGDMDPEFVPRRWGALFEVVGEGRGWAGAELDAMAKSMNFERARTGVIYAVNFITDEEGIDIIRADGEGRLYHRLKDRVYLWAQTWFFPLDKQGRISRHPHLVLAPAYRGVRAEWMEAFNKRLNLLCFPMLYALGRLNSGAARLESEEGGAGRYRIEDVSGGHPSPGTNAASGGDAGRLYEGFRDALVECERPDGGEHEVDGECVNRLVGRDPAGAEAYVEFCCSDAASDEGHLRLAAAVALAYEDVFDDPVLRRRVLRRANEMHAPRVVELLTRAEDDGDAAGSVN